MINDVPAQTAGHDGEGMAESGGAHAEDPAPAPDFSDMPTQPHPSSMESQGGGNWEVRTMDGQIYGPVPRSELDQWVAEGRVSAVCFLRQDYGEWIRASQLYPHLTGAGTGAQEVVGAAPLQKSPDADRAVNPYAPTGQGHSGGRSNTTHLRSHNGVAVLICGVLGLLCCVVFGIVACVVGASDLSAMKRGEMDNSGHGLVVAGLVLGIISVVIKGGGFLIMVLTNSVNF